MLDITEKSVSIGNGQATGTRPDGTRVLLGSDEVTKAIARYARRHNHYARTIRTNTTMYAAAIREWCEDHEPSRAMKS